MNAPWQIAVIAALVLGLLGVMAGLSHLARLRGWHPEVARKIVHVAAAGVAIPLPWIVSDRWPVWLLLGVSLVAMLAMRTRFLAAPGRALHAVERESWGDIFLLVSVGLLFLLYEGEPVLYVLPLLVLALGDAAAALTGSVYGRAFYRTADGRKSVEGSTMFFLVTLILAMVCLLLLTDIGRGAVILVALGISLFAMVIEADSWRGYDNLFLPMGAFLFLYTVLGADGQGGSLSQMAVPVLAMVAAYGASRAAGLNRQVSRIHAAALFMLVSATDPANAVLPGLVLLVHAVLGIRDRAGQSTLDTLNVVSAVALVGFGFLALGRVLGPNALNFYALGCGTAAAALVGQGVAGWPRRLGPVAAIVLAGGIWGLWWVVTGQNGPETRWHGPLGLLAGGVVGLAGLAPLLVSGGVRGASGSRLVLLGALPASGFYMINYLWAGAEFSG